MKKIYPTLFLALIISACTEEKADPKNIYATYESTFQNDMFGDRKNLTPNMKKAFLKSHMTVTINKQNVILTIGQDYDGALVMDYELRGDIILATYKEASLITYYPIYLKDNYLYTSGQRFVKTNNLTNSSSGTAKPHATPLARR